MVRVVDKRGVAGEEPCPPGIKQVHVRRAAPAIVPVPIASVRCTRRANCDVAYVSRLTWREIDGVRIAETAKPFRDNRWREERDRSRQAVDGVERQMIGMRVSEQDRVERRKLVERNSRCR